MKVNKYDLIAALDFAASKLEQLDTQSKQTPTGKRLKANWKSLSNFLKYVPTPEIEFSNDPIEEIMKRGM
jgi:CRISPR/Cas system CMR-associated protein Cmr5 small subunit